MSNPFKLRVKYYGETIINAKGENVEDFDEVMEGLKHKFKGERRS